MVSATLTKTESGGNTYTMTFNTMLTWGGNAVFPVVASPLPQEDSDKQILLKIMGNSTDTKYGWIMKDEATTVVTGTGSPNIKTVPEQIAFWLSTMRPKLLTDQFTLTFNFTAPLIFEGLLSNFKWDMSGDAPVSANCSFQFLQGDVIATDTYETDTPSPPLNVVADSPSAGNLRQTWEKPLNKGTSDIGAYVFVWREVGSQPWLSTSVSSGTFTKTQAVTGGKSYQCAVLAENVQGTGESNKAQIVAVA